MIENTKYWQRAWTMAELAREHPLPEGWRWIADSGDCWSAVCQGGAVGVDEFGHVFFTSPGMPSEVVFAVIQASTQAKRPVFLWLLSQSVNSGYDTYDSAVVAAHTEDEARHVHPQSMDPWWRDRPGELGLHAWASPELLTVQRLGIADESITAGTVVCASFNAG